jgi:hypothetical protein
MSILLSSLKEFISGEEVASCLQYQVYIRDCEVTKIGIKHIELNVLVVLMDDSIFLEEVLAVIEDYIKRKRLNKRITCNIFISSPRGSIYLYETLVKETAWKKHRHKKRLCVVNSDNGIMCLRPGHVMNKIITERVRFLLETVRSVPKEAWDREMRNVFEVCIENMKR